MFPVMFLNFVVHRNCLLFHSFKWSCIMITLGRCIWQWQTSFIFHLGWVCTRKVFVQPICLSGCFFITRGISCFFFLFSFFNFAVFFLKVSLEFCTSKIKIKSTYRVFHPPFSLPMHHSQPTLFPTPQKSIQNFVKIVGNKCVKSHLGSELFIYQIRCYL